MKKIFYFGTDLRQHGHYYFELSETGFNSKYDSNIEKEVDFNPERLPRKPGQDKYDGSIEKGYTSFNHSDKFFIISIAGSAVDKRGGTKSVFFDYKNKYSDFNHFKRELKEHPMFQKILEAMPFNVPEFGKTFNTP